MAEPTSAALRVHYRCLARTVIGDDVVVSTLSFGFTTTIRETMVVGGPHDGWVQRYATDDEAIAGHERVVKALRHGRAP